MGFVQGRVDLREKDGRLQMSRDGGATWNDVGSSGWSVVERKAITVDAQSYTFSSLNGDLDEAYMISAEIKGGAGAAGGLLSLRPNGLTSNQIGDAIISDTGGAPTVDPGRTELMLGYTPVAGRFASSYGTLFAKTGSDRCLDSNGGIASIRRVFKAYSRWTDTAINITSLVVFSADPPGLGVGTVLTLYKRAIPG